MHRVPYQPWSYAAALKPDPSAAATTLFDIDLQLAAPGSHASAKRMMLTVAAYTPQSMVQLKKTGVELKAGGSVRSAALSRAQSLDRDNDELARRQMLKPVKPRPVPGWPREIRHARV